MSKKRIVYILLAVSLVLNGAFFVAGCNGGLPGMKDLLVRMMVRKRRMYTVMKQIPLNIQRRSGQNYLQSMKLLTNIISMIRKLISRKCWKVFIPVMSMALVKIIQLIIRQKSTLS